VQGVDVPFAFDSGNDDYRLADGPGQQTFRPRARVREIRGAAGGPRRQRPAIDCIADFTFFGKDMHNNDVMW
jgi:hypothetical protein